MAESQEVFLVGREDLRGRVIFARGDVVLVDWRTGCGPIGMRAWHVNPVDVELRRVHRGNVAAMRWLKMSECLQYGERMAKNSAGLIGSMCASLRGAALKYRQVVRRVAVVSCVQRCELEAIVRARKRQWTQLMSPVDQRQTQKILHHFKSHQRHVHSLNREVQHAMSTLNKKHARYGTKQEESLWWADVTTTCDICLKLMQKMYRHAIHTVKWDYELIAVMMNDVRRTDPQHLHSALEYFIRKHVCFLDRDLNSPLFIWWYGTRVQNAHQILRGETGKAWHGEVPMAKHANPPPWHPVHYTFPAQVWMLGMEYLKCKSVNADDQMALKKQVEKTALTSPQTFVLAHPPRAGDHVEALSAKGTWWPAQVTHVYRTGHLDVDVHDGHNTKWTRVGARCIWRCVR